MIEVIYDSDIEWQIRDVKHGKIFSFSSLDDLVEFVLKIKGDKDDIEDL